MNVARKAEVPEPILDGKRILVTGGTGSLGRALVRRLLAAELGTPSKVTVFSRDEGKHHQMRVDFMNLRAATDEVAYHNFERILEFRLGDVRDYRAVSNAVREADIVINAAALKQVPSCEYFPYDAVRTNIEGAHNLVNAIREWGPSVKTALTISTDKACKPINVMGMTKAIQERLFVEGNLGRTRTTFAAVRYGNVVASRGSVVPLFEAQIARGGPITITTPDMTRFLLTLDSAVDTVFAALISAGRGEIFVPVLPSVRIVDLATVMIGALDIEITFTGIRPGEKVHEILVSAEEVPRTVRRGDYFVIEPMLPELLESPVDPGLDAEFSSATSVLPREGIPRILQAAGVLRPDLSLVHSEAL